MKIVLRWHDPCRSHSAYVVEMFLPTTATIAAPQSMWRGEATTGTGHAVSRASGTTDRCVVGLDCASTDNRPDKSAHPMHAFETYRYRRPPAAPGRPSASSGFRLIPRRIPENEIPQCHLPLRGARLPPLRRPGLLPRPASGRNCPPNEQGRPVRSQGAPRHLRPLRT